MPIPPVSTAARPTAVSAPPVGPHADAQTFTFADLVGGSQGRIRTETLDNGVRLVIAERPGAHSTKLQVGIGAGSLQDPAGKTGLAHLLEHLAFEGSPTRSAAEQERIRNSLGNNWNAYTNDKAIVFYGIVPAANAKTGANLLTDMFRNPAMTGPQVKQEHDAVKNEMIDGGGELMGERPTILDRMVLGEHPALTNVIGTRKTVDAITAKDLRAYHQQYFVGRNTVALVEGDPDKLALDTLRRELGKLPAGARVDNTPTPVPVVRGQALQVINDPSVDTVTLDVLLPIAPAAAAGVQQASIVTKAISNRLNNVLRRDHDLTYGVRAGLTALGDGSHAVSISTTVAAANARTAMRDIVKTLQDGRDGFGPTRLDVDKKGMLADLRAADDDAPLTVSERAEATFDDALANPGTFVLPAVLPDSRNADRAAIGRYTMATFAQDAELLLDLSNMKVLASGQLADGGAQVRDGLADAGVDTGSLSVNPVDLKPFQDMGMRVTKDTTPPMR